MFSKKRREIRQRHAYRQAFELFVDTNLLVQLHLVSICSVFVCAFKNTRTYVYDDMSVFYRLDIGHVQYEKLKCAMINYIDYYTAD